MEHLRKRWIVANSRCGSEGRRGARRSALLLIGAGALVALHCGPRVGGPAPPIDLRDGGGAAVSLASLKGSPVVVSFWATWCGPCRMELPDLVRLQKEMGRVKVLLVSREDPKTTGTYLDQQGIALTSLSDESGAVHGSYNVSAYPTLFVIDAAGNIRESHVGYSPGGYERLKGEVAAASS
ncbi:MAG: TlpA disulfide reductase family protein [Acidobacteriota bacterium]